MLFLSSGNVDVTPRSTAIEQQQQEITVYQVSVILKETHTDAPVSELEMGQVTHTLVGNCQPNGEMTCIVQMEKSPRLGKAQHELSRWLSLSSAGRHREEVVVEEDEEELEEVIAGKMKTDKFFKPPSKYTGNSLQQHRDVVELTAQPDAKEQLIQSSTSCSATIQAKGLVHGNHDSVPGRRSLPWALLRRSHQDEALLGRRTMSMYDGPVKVQRDRQPEQERRLLRPRSVCMLPGAVAVLPEPQAQESCKWTGSLDSHQHRSRKAELRAVDGLNPVVAQRPSGPTEVNLRVRQRSWKPRPVSMTVLELKKRGSDDEINSERSGSHRGGEGEGFFKGGLRWKLFGKTSQEKNKEKQNDKDAKISPKNNKSDTSRSTLSSLRRSFSLRIRRTRPRDLGPGVESKEYSQTKSTAEEATMPPQPFSYLTGRKISTSSDQTEDGGMQYIQYHSRGKVKVMEVPLHPPKLTSKPVQEEQSIWQLIANRFRRKDQPSSGKSEIQQSQSKDSGQYPQTGNNKSQPVTIETLAGIDSHKGQGKTCKTADLFLSSVLHFIYPLLLTAQKVTAQEK